MPIEDKLLFCGTLGQLNQGDASRDARYAIDGHKIGKEYYGSLNHAISEYKKFLSRHGYCGAVEFSCKPLLAARVYGYSITAAPIRRV